MSFTDQQRQKRRKNRTSDGIKNTELSPRQLRVGELVRHEIALLLSGNILNHPLLRNQPFTVTQVKVSPDMRAATVFCTPTALDGTMIGAFDETTIKELLKALSQASGFLRQKLAAKLQLKRVPSLSFKYDGSFDFAVHITRKLQDLNL